MVLLIYLIDCRVYNILCPSKKFADGIPQILSVVVTDERIDSWWDERVCEDVITDGPRCWCPDRPMYNQPWRWWSILQLLAEVVPHNVPESNSIIFKVLLACCTGADWFSQFLITPGPTVAYSCAIVIHVSCSAQWQWQMGARSAGTKEQDQQDQQEHDYIVHTSIG